MISLAVSTKISKSTFSHPFSKFLATAKVGLAHDDSFRGAGSQIIIMERLFWILPGDFSDLVRNVSVSYDRSPVRGENDAARKVVHKQLRICRQFTSPVL